MRRGSRLGYDPTWSILSQGRLFQDAGVIRIGGVTVKMFFALLVAVALGIVGGALWGIVADGCAAAAATPERPGLMERMRTAREERRKPVRERMVRLRTKIAERRDRRGAQGNRTPPVAATPSQTGPSSRAPKAPAALTCPACALRLDRADLSCEQLQ